MIGELMEELDTLSEEVKDMEWQRAYRQVSMDAMIYYDFTSEEREFICQRASYLIEQGNKLLRSL